MVFQSSFMLTTVHPFELASSRRLVEFADWGRAIVSPFPGSIGMDKEAEARTGARGGPLKHLEIAIGVSECGERPAADESLNADSFAFAIADELHLRQFDSGIAFCAMDHPSTGATGFMNLPAMPRWWRRRELNPRP